MALGVALVALGVALAALAALVVALDGFSLISLVFFGFPWIPGGRGGDPGSHVRQKWRVKRRFGGPNPVSRLLDPGYRI